MGLVLPVVLAETFLQPFLLDNRKIDRVTNKKTIIQAAIGQDCSIIASANSKSRTPMIIGFRTRR
jgi:hypothetical protein